MAQGSLGFDRAGGAFKALRYFFSEASKAVRQSSRYDQAGWPLPVPSPGLFEALGIDAAAADLSKSSVNYEGTAFMPRQSRRKIPSSNLPWFLESCLNSLNRVLIRRNVS